MCYVERGLHQLYKEATSVVACGCSVAGLCHLGSEAEVPDGGKILITTTFQSHAPHFTMLPPRGRMGNVSWRYDMICAEVVDLMIIAVFSISRYFVHMHLIPVSSTAPASSRR